MKTRYLLKSYLLPRGISKSIHINPDNKERYIDSLIGKKDHKLTLEMIENCEYSYNIFLLSNEDDTKEHVGSLISLEFPKKLNVSYAKARARDLSSWLKRLPNEERVDFLNELNRLCPGLFK